MTHEHDFMRLHMTIGMKDLPLKLIGLEWPPPRFIEILGTNFRILDEKPDDEWPQGEALTRVMVQVGRSKLTDEQIKLMAHVARGAEYHYLTENVWPTSNMLRETPEHVQEWMKSRG